MAISERTFNAADLMDLGWDSRAAEEAAAAMTALAEALEPLATDDVLLSSNRLSDDEPLPLASSANVIAVRYSVKSEDAG